MGNQESGNELGAVGETARGFEIVRFVDRYGVACSLQQSSIATESCIWLGCDSANPREFVPYGDPPWQPVPMPETYVADTRMHLNREQVQALIVHLQSWLDSDSFART